MDTPDGGGGMKGVGRATWLKLGAVGILFFIAAYGLVALESSQKRDELPVRRTTYSAAAGGYKALYLWLKALNVPIKRWETGFGELHSDASVLLLVEPELGPGTGELEALNKWVRQGGTFVLITRRPNVFLENFELELKPVFGMLQEQDQGEELMLQPGVYTDGVRNLSSRGHPELGSQRPEVVIHLRSKSGGLLSVVDEGKGRVITLADPNLFCNESLREADNSLLALNLLLTHRGEGILLVDEYHHGYGRAMSVMEHLTHSRAMEPMLQGVFLLLILLAAKGRRFGPPRRLIQEERRSSLEYVRAMAQLFQRAKARVFAFEALCRWIEDEAKKILVNRDRGLQSKLQSARQRTSGEEMTERELLASVRRLYTALDEARRRAAGTSRQ